MVLIETKEGLRICKYGWFFNVGFDVSKQSGTRVFVRALVMSPLTQHVHIYMGQFPRK